MSGQWVGLSHIGPALEYIVKGCFKKGPLRKDPLRFSFLQNESLTLEAAGEVSHNHSCTVFLPFFLSFLSPLPYFFV